jgi:peptide deformylase
MAIRTIRKKGDDILTKKAKKIEVIDEKIKTLAQDMLDTMYANDGIGLAACQVGMLKSMVVYDAKWIEDTDSKGRKITPKKEPHILINPVIINRSKSMVEVEEGCLSFPNEFDNVMRHEKIKVEYTDIEGKKKVKSASGMEAVVIQHELDHLDGIVFLDRVYKK